MNYWKESIEAAFDEAGLWESWKSLAEDKKASFVKSIELSSDMKSEASGELCIPHPLKAEVENLEKKVKRTEAERDKQRSDFVANVAMRHNVHPSQVSLTGNGHAMVYP